MARDLFSLDVETAAKDKRHAAYAGLEPWRVWQNQAHITSISICDPYGAVETLSRRKSGDASFEASLLPMLKNLEGRNVYAHNACFDLAWILASTRSSRTGRIPDEIRRIRWYDSMLLAKWVVNGQKADDIRFSLSLANLVQSFLKTHPLTEEFINVKKSKVEAFGNDEYWESRNALDVILTQALAAFLEAKLDPAQITGYATEMRNLIPVANSWIVGIYIDQAQLSRAEADFNSEQAEILARIKLSPSVLTSPKQLGHLLFTELKLDPESYTPTGAPRTSADDLKMIAFKLTQAGNTELGAVMKDILKYKQIATLQSKYIKGCKAALDHTGDGYIYCAPRIFGTYTGRFTYSSKTMDAYRTGIAFHQIPRRGKSIRSFLCPPPGFKGYEADAAGQESRLMAIRSKDPVMLRIFKDGLDFHAMTGSGIIGMEYTEFMDGYKKELPEIIEKRQFGKLTNLSCNYRIGGKALAKKAFDDYDMFISIDKGTFFVNTFTRSYVNVPVYWDEVIKFARTNGYTEAFGGRRYKIHDWSFARRWESESTAINTPIQGAGASQKNIVIAETFDRVPEAIFCLDLHDASFFWIPEESAVECGAKLDHVLETIDYSQYWGFTPPISLPFESKIGKSFSDLK